MKLGLFDDGAPIEGMRGPTHRRWRSLPGTPPGPPRKPRQTSRRSPVRPLPLRAPSPAARSLLEPKSVP